MLNNSTQFRLLLEKYIEHDKAENILREISFFENSFAQRTKLQNINNANFSTTLNSSVEFIEKSNAVLSLNMQLHMKIKQVYSSKKRLLELNQISRTQTLEASDLLTEVKSKTEKDKLLKNKLKNEFIALEQEIEEIKDDLEFIDYFISTSKDTKCLAESYYQSVKQINNFF